MAEDEQQHGRTQALPQPDGPSRSRYFATVYVVTNDGKKGTDYNRTK